MILIGQRKHRMLNGQTKNDQYPVGQDIVNAEGIDDRTAHLNESTSGRTRYNERTRINDRTAQIEHSKARQYKHCLVYCTISYFRST